MAASSLDVVVSWAKRRGFVYPGSEIYGGLANAWDLGPYGSLLRKNIYDIRWKYFVQEQENIYGIDGAILMHPKVREASGHVAGFNDPLIDDKNTGERFRADKLIEAHIEQQTGSDKAKEDIWLETVRKEVDPHIPNLVPGSWTLEQQKAYIVRYIPNNPNTKQKANRTDVRKFSLMLSTKLGVLEDESAKVRLRPETAQAMFVDFKNVIDTMRVRLPFGLAQVGKAFRNEITPGNFLFRTREFEQMEIQMFVEPDDAPRQFDLFVEQSWDFWLNRIGLHKENLRTRDHAKDELAHYARQARDFEYRFPWGWGELQGIHDRTNFDLSQHQAYSGKDLQYADPVTGKRFIPHVVELSMGLSRSIATVMIDAYDEEVVVNSNQEEEKRVVVRFHKDVAPIKFAIFPLIKKDERQVAVARDLFKKLSKHYMCEYDDNGAIGKRYRRQDEIGTPYCITIDYDTVDTSSPYFNTVTIRDRDTMRQERVKMDEIKL